MPVPLQGIPSLQVSKVGVFWVPRDPRGDSGIRSPMLVLEFHPFKMTLRALSSSWLRGFRLKPFSSGLPRGRR